MELVASIEQFISPVAPFLTLTDSPFELELCRVCQSEHEEQDHNTSNTKWSLSITNPQNRLNAFYPSQKPRWRIDGCIAMGRQIFAVPVYMSPDLPLKRIDIIIPCPSRQPHGLRCALRSSYLFSMSGQAVNGLDISHYIIQCLERWSGKQKNFEVMYRNLPFGSKIWIENIVCNLDETRIRILPNLSFTEKLRSVEILKAMWKVSLHSWPRIVGLNQLQYVSQLNGNVSIVQLPRLYGSKQFVFKTNLRSVRHMYHELKLLLSMEEHCNVISRPQYLLSIDDSPSASSKVVGFLLEYYPCGTLGTLLEAKIAPSKSLKLKWAVQIAQTLSAIINGPARYYSDLKLDNLLLQSPSYEILFIDFEQAGNWDTFNAPEIMYIGWMKKLAELQIVPEETRKRYKAFVETQLRGCTCAATKEVYTNPPQGYNDIWNSLPPLEQEAAMVYSFGKILWCIFEECSHTSNSMDEKYEVMVDLEFPQFFQTPDTIRNLIRRCTSGAPEFIQEEIKLVRQGARFFAENRAIKSGGDLSSPQATMDAAKGLWARRLQRMEDYVDARSRWAQGNHNTEDELLLGFPMRPSLAEILEILTTLAGEKIDGEP